MTGEASVPVVSTHRPALVVIAVLAILAGGCGTGGGRPAAEPTGDTGGPTVVHATSAPPLHPSVDGYPTEAIEIRTADGTHRLAVLVADTPARRQHGLMEVESLPDGVGMLFVGYESDRTSGFWMKDTLVPLTIAYLAADGTVVALIDMEPCTSDPCPTYAPDEPYRSALEVRQGWFSEHGISEGAVVRRPSVG